MKQPTPSWLLRTVALIALALFFPLQLQAAAQGVNGKPLTEKQIKKLLDDGNTLLGKGMPDVAIAKDFDPVIEHFERIYKDSPGTVFVAHDQQEMILYSVLMPAAAEKDAGIPRDKLNTEVLIDGAWTDALIGKAYALVELHRFEDAKPLLERATALSPLFPRAWSELGYVLQTQKDWPAALKAFESAEGAAELIEDGAVKNDHLARAWRGEGFVLTEQGKLDESEALYKKCLELNPDDYRARNELQYINSLRVHPPAAPSP